MVENTLELTIQEFLEMKHHSEERVYGYTELEMFSSISNIDTWGMEIKTLNDLKERKLVVDTYNDGRARQIYIVAYKGTPFAIYQYMGKGYIENEIVFNKNVLSEFLIDYIKEYISYENSYSNKSVSDTYIARNYNGAKFKVENNSIVSYKEEIQ